MEVNLHHRLIEFGVAAAKLRFESTFRGLLGG